MLIKLMLTRTQVLLETLVILICQLKMYEVIHV